jgi:hypothetical protein
MLTNDYLKPVFLQIDHQSFYRKMKDAVAQASTRSTPFSIRSSDDIVKMAIFIANLDPAQSYFWVPGPHNSKGMRMKYV